MILVNTVIKPLFAGLYGKELHETLDTFWSEYIEFNHKNDPFDSNEFIWSSKDIRDVNNHSIRNNPYHTPKSLVLYLEG